MASDSENVVRQKVAVVGTGAVGGILAAHLASAGHAVVACDVLEDHLRAIDADGLRIHGSRQLTGRCAGTALGEAGLSAWPDLETIVVATKAWALPRFVRELPPLLRSRVVVVACQNGLGNEEFLAEAFGRDRVLRIVPNYAGAVTGPGEVCMTFFHPPNWIGALSEAGEERARALADALTAAGLATESTHEVRKHVWEKTILNTSLNPVCALTRKTMKDMMDDPLASSLVEELLREAMRVADADGVRLDDGFFEHGLQYLRTAGHHWTSMSQDVTRGLPTEIDWLNAKVVERGRALGVPTPHHLAIWALVKGLETKSGAAGA